MGKGVGCVNTSTKGPVLSKDKISQLKKNKTNFEIRTDLEVKVILYGFILKRTPFNIIIKCVYVIDFIRFSMFVFHLCL